MNFIAKMLKVIKKEYKVVPDMVLIDIANRCNAQCPFCARQLSELKRNELMSKEMFYDIINQVKRIKSVKTIAFAAWGEPMLHPNFDEFVNYVLNLGYKVGFPTNMSLADKHMDTLLKVDFLMISVEGHDKESYEKSRKNLNFEKVYNNIVELDRKIKENKAKGLKVPHREVNYLIDKNSNIKKYMELWYDYVDSVRIGPILPAMIWNEKNKTTSLKIDDTLKKSLIKCKNRVQNMHCAMPFKSIYIRANGKLALCCSDYDIDINFGDCTELLHSYKNNKNFKKVRDEFITGNLNICKNCFQNFLVTKEELFEVLPSLQKYENDKKITIYQNR